MHQSYNYTFLVIKIYNVWGDLTDMSSIKPSLRCYDYAGMGCAPTMEFPFGLASAVLWHFPQGHPQGQRLEYPLGLGARAKGSCSTSLRSGWPVL